MAVMECLPGFLGIVVFGLKMQPGETQRTFDGIVALVDARRQVQQVGDKVAISLLLSSKTSPLAST